MTIIQHDKTISALSRSIRLLLKKKASSEKYVGGFRDR
jgi:hypothetical protein